MSETSILIVLCTTVLIPWCVFLSAKLGTVGFLNARHRFYQRIKELQQHGESE